MTPHRHLFDAGRTAWEQFWQTSTGPGPAPAWLLELVLVLCEQIDERHLLRMRVFQEPTWRDRVALRALDTQLVATITAIADRITDAHAARTESAFNDLLAALGDPA